jgi:hypothetical protein
VIILPVYEFFGLMKLSCAATAHPGSFDQKLGGKNERSTVFFLKLPRGFLTRLLWIDDANSPEGARTYKRFWFP